MSKSQRRFPREEVQIEVELSFLEDTAHTVVTRDISQGGVFLQLDDIEHYPMGEMVTMHFKNPLDNDKETTKDAIIVRHSDKGIAVAFVEIDGF